MGMNEDQLRQNLTTQKGQITRIAKESGISYSWLIKFASGHISNPTVRSLRRLESALTESRQRPTTAQPRKTAP